MYFEKRSLKLALATFFVALTIPYSVRAGPVSGFDGLEKFMANLGFRDYSAEIRDTLKKDETEKKLTIIQKQTLQMNEERYQSYNAARELAIRILKDLYVNPSQDQIEKTIQLTASQMGLKPTRPPQDWPKNISDMPEKTQADKDAKDKAKLQFIQSETLKDINTQTTKTASDIVEILYGASTVNSLNQHLKNSGGSNAPSNPSDLVVLKDLQQISAEAENLTAFLYLDGEMGDNVLGQTLALGLRKFEIDRNKSAGTPENNEITAELTKAAATYGERLQDYVGNTVLFQDRKRGDVPVTFHTGMIIAERAAIYPQESSELAWAARPGSVGNWLRAFKLNLLGDPVGMAIGFEDGGDKPQSFLKKIRYTLQQLPVFNRGLSHAGWVYVFKDPETGIESVKAMDVYPGLVHGGIRIIKIKKFASQGINLRFATTKIDALQFRQWAREQINRGLISKTAWDGKKEFVDENGKPIPNAPMERDDWQTTPTPEEVVQRFNAYTDDQAQEWFENEVTGRALARVFDFLTVDGVAFAENFTDYKWRSYCSKLVALTVKMESGFDIQTYPDQFNLIARIAGKVDLARGTDFAQRIVAPGGLFWQRRGLLGKPLAESTEIINFPDGGNFKNRMDTQFGQMEPDFNPQTTQALEDLKVIQRDQQIPNVFISDTDSGLDYRITRAIDSHFDKIDRKVNHPAGLNRAGVQGPAEGYLGSCPILLEAAGATP